MIKLLLATICISMVALTTPQFLAAEVNPKITYDYYDVPYVSGLPLNEMIKRVSPLVDNKNGHRVTGLNKWYVRYDSLEVVRPQIDVCQLKEFQVNVTCHITLPRLSGGDAQAAAEFHQMVENVKTHELEHCTIATTHANLVQTAFSKMPAHPCPNLAGEMEVIFDKILDDCKVEQNRFDHDEYKYSQHLYLNSLQSMMDAGFDVLPPAEGDWAPQLNPKGRVPFKNLPRDETPIEGQGLYKDENGVWRNY